jgi:hypothetical protein
LSYIETIRLKRRSGGRCRLRQPFQSLKSAFECIDTKKSRSINEEIHEIHFQLVEKFSHGHDIRNVYAWLGLLLYH